MTLMQLVEILASESPTELHTVNEKIEYARKEIFSFDYPLYDESKKKEFETRFIKHFYTRSLGFETPYLWKFKVDEAFNLLLPYYNQLWESTLLSFEPLKNFFLEETFRGTRDTDNKGSNNLDSSTSLTTDKTNTQTLNTKVTENRTGTDTSENTETHNLTLNKTKSNSGTNRDLFSDTPQAVLADLDYATNLRDINTSENGTETDTDTGTITSNGTKTATENGEKANTGTITDTGKDVEIGSAKSASVFGNLEKRVEEYTNTKSGLTGNYTYQDLIMKLRKTYINVTQMFFEDINVESLFMLIF